MKTIGNIIWVLFGGLELAVGYFCSVIALCITIIGIPFGVQIFKLGTLALWPFGKDVKKTEGKSGCLNTLMNVLWFLFGGIGIVLSVIDKRLVHQLDDTPGPDCIQCDPTVMHVNVSCWK